MDRSEAMRAIEATALQFHLHPAVTEDMKVSDFCMDSLEYVDFLIGVETFLGHGIEIPEDKAPPMDGTVGDLAGWIVEVLP